MYWWPHSGGSRGLSAWLHEQSLNKIRHTEFCTEKNCKIGQNINGYQLHLKVSNTLHSTLHSVLDETFVGPHKLRDPRHVFCHLFCFKKWVVVVDLRNNRSTLRNTLAARNTRDVLPMPTTNQRDRLPQICTNVQTFPERPIPLLQKQRESDSELIKVGWYTVYELVGLDLV